MPVPPTRGQKIHVLATKRIKCTRLGASPPPTPLSSAGHRPYPTSPQQPLQAGLPARQSGTDGSAMPHEGGAAVGARRRKKNAVRTVAARLIVVAVTVYRYDRPQSGGRSGNDVQQPLSVVGGDAGGRAAVRDGAAEALPTTEAVGTVKIPAAASPAEADAIAAAIEEHLGATEAASTGRDGQVGRRGTDSGSRFGSRSGSRRRRIGPVGRRESGAEPPVTERRIDAV